MGGGVKSRKVLKKRKQSSGPADEIASEDEGSFRTYERKAAEKAVAEDQKFQPTGES